jgi:alpha-glucoside transport system substrate-binding protein
VTVEVTENAPNLFSVFDAVDRAVVALLEGFTGNPVAFGTLTLAGDWQPERDRIFLDGATYDVSGARITGLLAGEYQLVVTRRESDGATTELLSRTVEIEPDGLTAVTIPLRRVTTGSVEVIAGELPADQIVFAPGRGEDGLAAVVAVPPPAVSTTPRGTAEDLGQDLAGQSLVIYNYPPAYDALVAAFEEATGISVSRALAEDPAWRLDLALQTEQPPHVAFMSQPGPAFDLLDLEIVDNLYRVFDRAYLQQFYRRDVLAFGHPDPVAYDDSDRSVGLTTAMSLKSLYWYAPSIFMMWGISEPTTRSEMIRSLTQLRRASEAPYSFAIESGNSTGWMVTDWIEDRLLQTIPLEEFDAWSRGQVSFRDPVVEDAITRTIRTIRRTGEMYGGIDGVTNRSFSETLAPLVAQPPPAGMAFGPSFLAQWYQDDLDRLEFFPTPPENPENGTRRLVGGDIFVVVEATSAARAFIRFLNRPDTARLLADSLTAEGQIGNVVAHNAAVPDWYDEPQRSFATIIRDADYLRFDASDRMNREVGMERFLTGARSMVYGSDIAGTLNSIDRYRRDSLR